MIVKSIKFLIKHAVKVFYYGLLYRFFCIVPVDRKKILFTSYNGSKIAGNPLALYRYIKESQSGYKLIWLYDGPGENIIPDRIVRPLSLSYLYHLASAGFWVNNSNLSALVRKRKKTVFLQTWHGTPLKKIGSDIPESRDWTGNFEKRDWLKDASRWDYFISPSVELDRIFSGAFHLDSEVFLRASYPRNIQLIKGISESRRREICSQMGIDPRFKIILYAPTFRDGEKTFNLQLDLSAMKKALSGQYRIVLKMHPNCMLGKDSYREDEFSYDMSAVDDIQSLFLISDILITDYSSVFDYAVLNRPMIFYPYDLEVYNDILRGFYFDYEDFVPGPVCRKTEEIIDMINNEEDRRLKQKRDEFNRKFNCNDELKGMDYICRKIGLKF